MSIDNDDYCDNDIMIMMMVIVIIATVILMMAKYKQFKHRYITEMLVALPPIVVKNRHD